MDALKNFAKSVVADIFAKFKYFAKCVYILNLHAFFNPNRYGGGGIMAPSIFGTTWAETIRLFDF